MNGKVEGPLPERSLWPELAEQDSASPRSKAPTLTGSLLGFFLLADQPHPYPWDGATEHVTGELSALLGPISNLPFKGS